MAGQPIVTGPTRPDKGSATSLTCLDLPWPTIDVTTANDVAALLRTTLQQETPTVLVLDWSATNYIDWVGLETVLDQIKQSRSEIWFIGLSPSLKLFFTLHQLHKTFPIFSTKEDAQNSWVERAS